MQIHAINSNMTMTKQNRISFGCRNRIIKTTTDTFRTMIEHTKESGSNKILKNPLEFEQQADINAIKENYFYKTCNAYFEHCRRVALSSAVGI